MSAARIAVLGAGLAGLSAARALRDHGHEVVVFDKGRGPGGRISTRRAAGFAFDHGAQYFTARDPRFVEAVASWCARGVVAPWNARLTVLGEGASGAVRGDDVRYVGVPGMSALARELARDVDVRVGTRITALVRAGEAWRLADASGGDLGSFDRLVCTLPAPQAARLLGADEALARRASEVELRPCWAVLLGLAQPYGVPFDGAFVEGSSLSWVARNSSKPGRPAGEAWVLHAGPEWSAKNLEADPAEVVRALGEELERLTGAPLPTVVHGAAHHWRFAIPPAPLDVGALSDPARGLVVAGDWCNGARVEGAWLSGLVAAKSLLLAHA